MSSILPKNVLVLGTKKVPQRKGKPEAAKSRLGRLLIFKMDYSATLFLRNTIAATATRQAALIAKRTTEPSPVEGVGSA